MRQVRYNTFETNSSSVHALVISKKRIKDIDELPELYISHGEYGWQQETFTSPDDKISYLCQAIWDMNYEWFWSSPENEEEEYRITTKARKAIYEFLNPLYDMGIEFEFEDRYWNPGLWGEGYVDHAGQVEPLIEEFKKKPKKLLRFIFGENSLIVTGNDNEEYGRLAYVNNKDAEVFYKYN